MMFLFLDFDGVTHAKTGTPAFLPECMQPLATALEPYKIEIVVSSSWRLTNHLWELEEMLMPLGKPVVGKTPRVDEFNRHGEILEYLIINNIDKANWIALDDQPDFFQENCENVYFTNPDTGFRETDIEPFLEFLKCRLNKPY